jgi:hypothetical protein
MLWRGNRKVFFKQRIPANLSGNKAVQGYVKHYGKAISVEEWERTCNYYVHYFPRYAKKWAGRRGKAVHTLSDFGRPLIKWEDRLDETKIVRLK